MLALGCAPGFESGQGPFNSCSKLGPNMFPSSLKLDQALGNQGPPTSLLQILFRLFSSDLLLSEPLLAASDGAGHNRP